MKTKIAGLVLGLLCTVAAPAQTLRSRPDPPLARRAATPNSGVVPAKTATGGYYRLKLVKIVDPQGFGQPVEVTRLLVPADWRTDGGVRWNMQATQCAGNLIQPYFRAIAPDGITGVEIAPGSAWQASNDAMTQRLAAAGRGCPPGPVVGAVDFLRQSAIPRMRPNARVMRADPLPAVTQAKQTELNQTWGPMVQNGMVKSFRADAASVTIAYSQNGQPVEEWLSTTLMLVAIPAAHFGQLMQGQMNMASLVYQMTSEPVFAARAPEGKLDKKLVATILASIRDNPVYAEAAGQLVANLNNIARQGAMDRQRIWYQAQQQVSATISQRYQYEQASRDRAAQQFSDTVRGVETYVNPRTGERVDLVGGYDNAWVNNRGEFVVSDTPGFDPGAAFKEDWTALRKAR